jgi:hypothetical protein
MLSVIRPSSAFMYPSVSEKRGLCFEPGLGDNAVPCVRALPWCDTMQIAQLVCSLLQHLTCTAHKHGVICLTGCAQPIRNVGQRA